MLRFRRLWRPQVTLLAIVLLALIAGGCSMRSGHTATPIIHLRDLQPLPTPADRQIKPLRVAIASIVSPQGTVDSYTPLLRYLSAKSGRPVTLVQRRTYQEVNDLIASGEIDMAFVCTRSYVIGHREFGMELLAAPQVGGKKVTTRT